MQLEKFIIFKQVSIVVSVSSSSWEPISEIRDVTCHMGSHSVTCHPIQVNAPRLTPARPAGTRFTYPGEMEGWVDPGASIPLTPMTQTPPPLSFPPPFPVGQLLTYRWLVGWLHIPRWFTCPHPSSNRARRRATSLIEINALSLLSQ